MWRVANVRSFRDLIAYQKARELRKAVYFVCKRLPREHQYEIASQIRRAAYSVTLNIAEGYGVGTTQATLRDLRIARGSLAETLIDWQLAQSADIPQSLVTGTHALLHRLIQSMECRPVAAGTNEP